MAKGRIVVEVLGFFSRLLVVVLVALWCVLGLCAFWGAKVSTTWSVELGVERPKPQQGKAKARPMFHRANWTALASTSEHLLSFSPIRRYYYQGSA